MRTLLSHGADANAIYQSLRPLHVACREPSANKATTLTKRDAKGDAKGDGKTDVKSSGDAKEAKESKESSPVEIAKLLLDAGANPNLRDAAGSFPLHHAVHNVDLVV